MKIKNKMTRILSVLLAGAMSVTAFTACDSKKDYKKEESNLSVKEMLIDILNTSANSNTLSGIFSGDADTASKIDAEIEFGEGVTDALGTEVKPLTISSETKLKGSNAGTDIAVSYDDKNLVSLNGVYDNASKAVYIKVPELSDAYLSASSDDLEGLKDEVSSEAGLNFSSLAGSSTASSMVNKLSDLKITDYENLLDDYLKVIVDALPEASNEEDYKGTLSDVEYDYTLKTYTLTAEDSKKIIEDVFAKLKTDETVKDFVVSFLGSSLDITEETYESKLEEAQKSLTDELDDETSSEDINLIFDGKNIVGIKDDEATFMVIDQKDAYVISIESETLNLMFKATTDDEKLDFAMTMDIIDEDSKDMSMTFNVDDFEVVDKDNGLASGHAYMILTVDGTKVILEATDKAEDKKESSTFKLSIDDVEYLTMNTTNEITNASDISVPSGTIYTLDQMEDYQSSMKAEEFLTNVQTVLGDDLVAAISTLTTSADDNYDSSDDTDDVSVDDDEDAIYLEKYYNEDGSFNYDKLKEDLGEEEYEAFMSQIDLDDFDVDAEDIEL